MTRVVIFVQLTWALLHYNIFSQIFQTDISQLQSITRRHQHRSSYTVCHRAQNWSLFSSSYILHLSLVIASRSGNHQIFGDDSQLQIFVPISEVTNLTKELNACTDNIKTWLLALTTSFLSDCARNLGTNQGPTFTTPSPPPYTPALRIFGFVVAVCLFVCLFLFSFFLKEEEEVNTCRMWLIYVLRVRSDYYYVSWVK